MIAPKNLGKQKKGVFSLPPVSCWSAYYQVPKLNDRPMASGEFRLKIDHGLQNCFETAAGVGLARMKADRDEKREGLSLLWVIPALILAGILMVKAPLLLAKGLSSATMGAAKVAAESFKLGQVLTNHTGATPGLFPRSRPETTNSFAYSLAEPGFRSDGSPRQSSVQNKPEIYLTGIATLNSKAIVFLSNGEVYTSEDRELEFVSRRKAIIAGRTYVFAPAASSGKEGPPAARPAQPF